MDDKSVSIFCFIYSFKTNFVTNKFYIKDFQMDNVCFMKNTESQLSEFSLYLYKSYHNHQS